MGVIEADNLRPALARFALNSHQFGGIDFVAFNSVGGSDVLARHDAEDVTFAGDELSDEHSATFFRVGLLGVLAERVVVASVDVESQ